LIILLLRASLPFIFYCLLLFLLFLVYTFSFCIKQAQIIRWGCHRDATSFLSTVTIITSISEVWPSLLLLCLMSFFLILSTSWRPTILFLLILWSPRHILYQSDIFYLLMQSYVLCLLSSGAFWPFLPQFWFLWFCPTLIGC